MFPFHACSESSLPDELIFLSLHTMRLAVYASNSLCLLLLKVVSSPTLSLSCSVIFIGQANVVAIKTEQNKTQCTGFCSPQALISVFLSDPYLFLYICNSS